jgi:hypothetical protein
VHTAIIDEFSVLPTVYCQLHFFCAFKFELTLPFFFSISV